ncbi:uncharacterized protein LODBEIA_P59970 [Lodderomyces beijingensis]|uniref:Vacuolar sorting protein Vps3844 C-terminal domain-containing protein n=1 Tax=Lodderomyces beijingensis TaxID=1775926 RepID=A0ABP0ZUF3_9ASCO
MKFSNLVAWSLTITLSAASSAGSSKQKASVYRLPPSRGPSSSNDAELSIDDARVYLDSFVGKDQSQLKLDVDGKLVELLNEQYEHDSQHEHHGKPKLLVNVKGAEFGDAPIFHTDRKIHSYFKHHHDHDEAEQLTQELSLVSEHGYAELTRHFQYFQQRKNHIWTDFTTHQQVMSQYNPVNDQIFINELSSLIHLKEYVEKNQAFPSDVFVIQLASLLSIERRIGAEAATFKHSKTTMAELLEAMNEQFNILIVSTPSTSHDVAHLNKRSLELSKINTSVFKYGTKEACEIATNNCNSHGECNKISQKSNGGAAANGSEEWACVCVPSFNSTTSKTTTWVGYDCAKRDVSVQANLFLWTTVALLLVTVGGIKLLLGVGETPLPGVLDAATLPGKKTL